MNYIVMECHSSYAVLLDEEGRFLKAANLHYEVGQTVYDPVLMREKPEKGFRPVRWVTGGAAAIAACFLMLFGVNYYQNHMASYSSIYLTINPEVQMTLNRQGEILKLQGTNEDGRTLLEGYDGKGKDKVTVTDELIDRAIEMGFLSEGGLVSFSIDAPEEAVLQEYSKELESEVKRYLKNRLSITIEIIDRQTGDTETSTTEDPAQSQENSNEPVQETQQQTQPAEPEVYEDTDYGLENDGVTDNSETPLQPQVPQISEEEESDYDSSSDYGDSAYEGEDD